MQHKNLKSLLLFGLLLSAFWCAANNSVFIDGGTHIVVKGENVHGTPKASSFRVTLDGHALSVVFLENLGLVTIELETATGGEVEATQSYTPNGVNFYIPTAGSYIIYFTLENGDVYYGEFEVTD